MSGWWHPSSVLPRGPRWLQELQKSYQAVGWKQEEGEEKGIRPFLGLSFPHLYNGRTGLALKLCSARSRASGPKSGQDVTERIPRIFDWKNLTTA